MRTIYVHFAVAAVTFGWLLHGHSRSRSPSHINSHGGKGDAEGRGVKPC